MKRIGHIGNYYGGLHIKEKNGKYYWIIENHDTNFDNINEWQEIDESLYNELLNYHNPFFDKDESD